jgi:phage I-like protein
MVRTTVGSVAEADLSVERSESITAISADQTADVAAGDLQTTVLTAPSGTLIEVIGLFISSPSVSAASSGFHRVFLRSRGSPGKYIQAQSDNTGRIEINNNHIQTGNSVQLPSDAASQAIAINSIRFDDTRGLQITYDNRTDATQTDTRKIDLVGLERGVTT